MKIRTVEDELFHAEW